MTRRAAPEEPIRQPGWGMAGALLAVGLVGPLLATVTAKPAHAATHSSASVEYEETDAHEDG